MSWTEIALGDCIQIKHGFAFKSEYFSSEGQFVVLTPGNFYEGGGFRRRKEKDRYYSGDIPDTFILSPGDLIVAMTEQGPGLLGSSALIPDEGCFLHNQRIGLVDIFDPSIIDKKYLYYLFNTKTVRSQISGSATGVKVRHTAPDRICRVKAFIPDVSTQEKIADIIYVYDDLIENNRRRITLLEDAARQLYKEWFVRFRIPGHEHSITIDGIPEGWAKKPISSLTSFLARGMTPGYDDDGEYLIINQKCIRNRLLTYDLARRQSNAVKEQKIVRYGDVLINSTGTGTLGRVAQCWDSPENCTVDTHVTIARPGSDVDPHWFGYCLMELEAVFEGMGEGATNQKELKKDLIGALTVVTPPKPLQSQFGEFAKFTADQIVNLIAQNDKLAQARDLLLPKLMNGEITV